MVTWKSYAALIGAVCFSGATAATREDAAAAAAATAAAAAAAAASSNQTTVPGAYIVELADDQDFNSFYTNLGSRTEVTQRLNISSSLIRAVSFRLVDTTDEEKTIKEITSMPQVKQLWPVTLISAPKPTIHWTGAGLSAEQLKRRTADQGSGGYTPHVMTQVDRLRAKGFTGKGIRIGIVDTGVDYKHPALGGCFGPGCLISYGTDLVGDDYNGSNAPVPDDDPFEECLGHGTHVAGIIAAQRNPLGFTGATPDVELGMYRVFGCYDAVGSDVLIAAFNKAYDDGSDIITASIGGVNGWSEEPWSVAVQRIVEAGVPCTVAAGNDGNEALFYHSTAAGGKKVLSIASFENQDAVTYENGSISTSKSPSGGQPSSFTSWGPMYELEVKPQFGTPGGGILSTFPVARGSYAVLSGTSMATPLAASIVALIAQVRGKFDSALIENLLASTAKPNLLVQGEYPVSRTPLAPVPQQGAGLVQAYDAAYATALTSVSSLSFNDTEHFTAEVNFTVTNTGSEAITFNLSHVPAITAYTFQPGSMYPESFVPELVESYASLEFEPSTLTLEPGAEGVVSVFPTAPTNLPAQRLPVYSGYVVLNGTNGENLSIPYQGVVGNMRDLRLMDSRMYLSVTSDSMGWDVVAANTTFLVPAPEALLDVAVNASSYANDTSALSYGVLPNMFIIIAMGSAQVRVEVVPLDPQNAVNATDIFGGTKTLGNIAGYPLDYRRAIGWLSSWSGQLDNGRYALPGRYQFKVLTLKIFGDRGTASDWEVFDTVPFSLAYAINDYL